MSPLSPGQLIPALMRLQAARATLGADERALRAAPATSEVGQHATELLETRKDELSVVWPSEKVRFESVVNAAASQYAARAHSEPSAAAVAASGNALARVDVPPNGLREPQDAQAGLPELTPVLNDLSLRAGWESLPRPRDLSRGFQPFQD